MGFGYFEFEHTFHVKLRSTDGFGLPKFKVVTPNVCIKVGARLYKQEHVKNIPFNVQVNQGTGCGY